MFKHCFLLVLITLAGCSSAPTRYLESFEAHSAPAKGDVRIYFYRTDDSPLYWVRDAEIKIDGKVRGASSVGSIFYFDVPAGPHSIKTDMWDIPGSCEIILHAQQGKTYYYKVTARWESFNVMMNNLYDPISGMVQLYLDSLVQECSGAFAIMPVTESQAFKR